LLRIATVFNHEYDSGGYGPVYARWDARSQAIITGVGYIRRHKDCPGAPHAPSQTESASPGPHGAWLVHYEIGGQQLTDTTSWAAISTCPDSPSTTHPATHRTRPRSRHEMDHPRPPQDRPDRLPPG